MTEDLLSHQRMPRKAQLRAVQRALDAVNEVMDLQFQLDMDVLKEVGHAQVDLYRALHAAKQLRR